MGHEQLNYVHLLIASFIVSPTRVRDARSLGSSRPKQCVAEAQVNKSSALSRSALSGLSDKKKQDLHEQLNDVHLLIASFIVSPTRVRDPRSLGSSRPKQCVAEAQVNKS